MTRPPNWTLYVWILLLLTTLVLTIRADLAHLDWAAKLSLEGSPAPALDPESPTGYAQGQRHFLAPLNRGETYRWIAYTQDLLANGFFNSEPYFADSPVEGRPQQMPKLYAAWLALQSSLIHLFTGDPIPIAAERAALWDPLVTHALALFACAALVWRRFGPAAATAATAFLALFPLVSAQFIPGSLAPETPALLLAAFAIAQGLSRPSSLPSAVAAGLALWLSPTIGFPTILILSAIAAAASNPQRPKLAHLRWALAGAALSLVAWLVDQNPWSPAASELRYNHPLYALAWIGLGFALAGWQTLRRPPASAKVPLSLFALGILLLAPLSYTQLSHAFPGWLYSSAFLQRITSLDESRLFPHALAWLGQSSIQEAFFLALPILAVALVLALAYARRRKSPADAPPLLPSAIAFAAVLILTLLKLRWGVVATLLTIPILCALIPQLTRSATQIYTRAATAAFLFALFAWNQALPHSLQRPNDSLGLASADVEALAQRQFAHWIAASNPTRPVTALAPPEFSDSLLFHGGGRVLTSSAWESYPGLVAASRILSAPEETEAEAIIQSRELTHIILPSWDKVLPLLVQAPKTDGLTTLYDRLQRWVFPLYLRPIPYHLPAAPGFLDQKLAIFEVTPPQDEALSLSRLGEYFAEMDRPEPAGLVAQTLAESYPQDPNAAIARAIIYAKLKNRAGLAEQTTRLARDVTSGLVPTDWDRRFLRSLALALGNQRDLSKSELQACLDSMDENALYQLTAQQAFHLKNLAKLHQLELPDAPLAQLADARSAVYDRQPSR